MMSSPFAVALAQPGEQDRDRDPLPPADIRLAPRQGRIKGMGEPAGSSAAPFARYAAKMSFPLMGEGAVVLASAPSDTSTWNGIWPVDAYADDR